MPHLHPRLQGIFPKTPLPHMTRLKKYSKRSYKAIGAAGIDIRMGKVKHTGHVGHPILCLVSGWHHRSHPHRVLVDANLAVVLQHRCEMPQHRLFICDLTRARRTHRTPSSRPACRTLQRRRRQARSPQQGTGHVVPKPHAKLGCGHG